jgi:hypothetical protein
MTPQHFIAKWQQTNLSERSACQQHFLDLCELLDQPKPAEADIGRRAVGAKPGARGSQDLKHIVAQLPKLEGEDDANFHVCAGVGWTLCADGDLGSAMADSRVPGRRSEGLVASLRRLDQQ